MLIPRELVLDAGPLIALFNKADKQHQAAIRGFSTLDQAKASLFLPMPVLFEVYKWLLFRVETATARRALAHMLAALEIVPIGLQDLRAMHALLGHT